MYVLNCAFSVFNGLRSDTPGSCVMDGEDGTNWNFCVQSFVSWGVNQIPGPYVNVRLADLYVVVDLK